MIGAAFAAIAHVQEVMSFHSEASDLARLRHVPAGEAVRVHSATVEVLHLAAMLHDRSGGLFDVTVARALVHDGFLPRPLCVDLDASDGNMTDLTILDDRHVLCRKPLLIDLGGIAKGYAVDRAIAELAAAGVEHALVNAGGDLRVLGLAPQPIHLRAADGRLEGVVMLADGALASSANLLERRDGPQGVTVPHRGYAGRPVPFDYAVSVIAPTCVVADAMTKIVLADPRLGEDMLAEFGGQIVDRADWQLVS